MLHVKALHFGLRRRADSCHEAVMKLVRRGDHYHLRRRVPTRYHRVEPRRTVWISLHTDSETIAREKAGRIWADMIEAWEAKIAGDTDDAERRFEAARELAQVRGYRFLSSERIAKLPADQIVERAEAVEAAGRRGSQASKEIEAEALLGGAEKPRITVSRALEIFWTVAADRTLGKSDDQIRRWRNPRIKAVRNFIDVIGDLALEDITPDDMLDFREWWWKQVTENGLTVNSANKDFMHLANVMKTVNRAKRLHIDLPLDGLAFRKDEPVQRPAFSTAWIRDRILAPGALDGLNTEARCILLAMVNTGCRPSELQGLMRGQIELAGNIPFIRIEPEGRTLKSSYARRRIPLAGVSLEAFRECPDGFPRYRDKPGLSATVNKYLRQHGLCETPKHTLYSIRHNFEDRMIAARVDDRVRRDLFGHRLDRERYGAGASLEYLAEVIHSVAL